MSGPANCLNKTCCTTTRQKPKTKICHLRALPLRRCSRRNNFAEHPLPGCSTPRSPAVDFPSLPSSQPRSDHLTTRNLAHACLHIYRVVSGLNEHNAEISLKRCCLGVALPTLSRSLSYRLRPSVVDGNVGNLGSPPAPLTNSALNARIIVRWMPTFSVMSHAKERLHILLQNE